MSRNIDSLRDMAIAARRALGYIENVSKSDFEQDLEKQDSITYRILVLGEASKRLSAEFRESYSDIPWRQIAGMRNMLVHEYDQIDLEVLWDVLQNNIPNLLERLDEILNQIDSIDSLP
jgi:uncharacterized protein with HEPN domain